MNGPMLPPPPLTPRPPAAPQGAVGHGASQAIAGTTQGQPTAITDEPTPAPAVAQPGSPEFYTRVRTNYPAELLSMRIWYVAGPDQNGKFKVPCDRFGNRIFGKRDNKMTGEEALNAAESLGMGVGHLFNEDDGYIVIDIDVKTEANEPNPAKHTPPEKLQLFGKLALGFDTYTEYSSGGVGLHLLAKAKASRYGKAKTSAFVGIELYAHLQFIAVTGNVLFAKPIAECQADVNKLVSECWSDEQELVRTNGIPVDVEMERTLEELKAAIHGASNGEKAAARYNADTSFCAEAYPDGAGGIDGSRVDAAIVQDAVHFGGTNLQAAEYLLTSPQGQSVPERKKGHLEDYVHRTVAKARNDWVREQKERMGFDANFCALLEMSEKTGIAIPNHLAAHAAKKSAPTWTAPQPIGGSEWVTARSSPDCIVEHLFYADVGIFIASGGTGKTTLASWMMIHIVLGLPLFGHTVKKPGKVLFLTSEDSREVLVARLRYIADEMGLTDEQLNVVRNSILISDVSGTGFKFTEVRRDVVQPTDGIEQLINGMADLQPVIVFVDPAVSFGVGESRVNDAEQGLIDAARRIRNGLNCAVIYIHHTGKQNARDKTTDQYSGRGGSAFADGSRMVQVLQRLNPMEWLQATGNGLAEDEDGFVLSRPKLSYCKRQPDLYIKRIGFTFEAVHTHSDEDKASETDWGARHNSKAVLKLIADEIDAGRWPTGRTLEDLANTLDLGQKAVRAAVKYLKEERKIVEEKIPSDGKGSGTGGARHYLRPAASG